MILMKSMTHLHTKQTRQYGLKLYAFQICMLLIYIMLIYILVRAVINLPCLKKKKCIKPIQSVICFCNSITKSNGNVTSDNWFSSLKVIRDLKNNLKYEGILRRNRGEIPPELHSYVLSMHNSKYTDQTTNNPECISF